MRQIIASGGHGYDDPECVRLNQYIVEQSVADRPRVCLLAQAGGEHPEWIEKFHTAFGALGCETSMLSLFFPHTSEIEKFLLAHDIIYVGGGNTKSLLVLWREWQLEPILRRAWEQGVILAGSSAGAVCWFEECITDSVPGTMSVLPCLGLLRGSLCPHYDLEEEDSEEERRPAFQRLVGSGEIAAGYAADDQVALHFVDSELRRAVTSVEGRRAFRVDRDEGERVLDVEVLITP